MSASGIPADTARRQRLAADPARSAWVSANAGSGKTYVLSRRVIRLLLDGCDPARILCLTFTKAAAAEMSNRVFAVLGAWTTLDDTALAATIADMDGAPPSRTRLATARRLFTRALETPGGLKIQTIHGFCESILHQFPLEANVAGHFEVLDGLPQTLLLERARDQVILDALKGPETALGRAFALALERWSEGQFNKALTELIGSREPLQDWLDNARARAPAIAPDDVPSLLGPSLARALGVAVEDTPAAAIDRCLAARALTDLRLAALAAQLVQSGPNDQALAARIQSFVEAADPVARHAAWCAVLLTGKGEPRKFGSWVSKAIAKATAGLDEAFEQDASSLIACNRTLAGLATREVTLAFLTVGQAILARYARAKAERGALDYEDLIVRTARLLSTSEAAAWVQYKLDRGIDHVLVDEAQDTSPRQWQVIRALIGEFFAGDAARSATNRTVFAVGDEKQSIYSFQGAEPRAFREQARHLERRAREAGKPFEAVKLGLSFRSTPDVLAAVDHVFADPVLRDGIVSEAIDYEVHTAHRAHDPGLIEIWPVETRDDAPEPDDWLLPLDSSLRPSPIGRVAARIAATIGAALRGGETLDGTGRRIRAGDCLVLVRKRAGIVDALTRALKAAGIPVAGADRLAVTDHVGVKDLMALAQVCLLPEDDLSLATLLRSPVFGWSDEQLYALAGHRAGTRCPPPLWDDLCAAAGRNADARLVVDRLTDWQARARREAPYTFFAGLIGRDGLRRRFVARLGGEVDEVLDEVLALALDSERAGPATLQGFLAMLASEGREVKRQSEAGRDEVRIMTVHGAKGLEAPIVFLIDSGSAPVHGSHDPVFVRLADPDSPLDPPVLATSAGTDFGRAEAVDAALAAGRAEAVREYRRLLYVAMTRAADRLYVGGYAGAKPHADSWRETIAARLCSDTERVEPITDPAGTPIAHRWRARPLPPRPPRPDPATARALAPPPAWLQAPARPEPVRLTLRPSSAVDALALEQTTQSARTRAGFEAAFAVETTALAIGRATHRLLEILPATAPGDRATAGRMLVDRLLPAEPDAVRAPVLAAVLALMAEPDCAALFGPQARAEVAIAGRLTDRRGRVHDITGRIDRLLVMPDSVLVADFKTGAAPAPGTGSVDDSHLAQMAVYAHLVGRLYPDRPVRATLIYTAGPTRIDLAPALLHARLAHLLAAESDDPPRADAPRRPPVTDFAPQG